MQLVHISNEILGLGRLWTREELVKFRKVRIRGIGPSGQERPQDFG